MDDNEIWKSYPEFPWMEVSSFGCVRTLDRVVPTKKGTYFAKGRILKQYPDNDGYLRVGFRVNGKRVGRQVHRIVAQTFLPNPNNWPQVNHKDCNPSNNNADNLEWCTDKYNIQYREKYGISAAEALGRSLFAVNLKTLEVSRFSSQCDASRKLGVNQQNISGVVRGERNKAGGYWFTEDGDRATKISKSELYDITTGKMSQRPVLAINLNTLEVSRFESQIKAGRVLGVYQQNIGKVLKGERKTAGSYWFVNADENAVEATRDKLSDKVVDKVEELMNDKETQLA